MPEEDHFLALLSDLICHGHTLPSTVGHLAKTKLHPPLVFKKMKKISFKLNKDKSKSLLDTIISYNGYGWKTA